MTGSPGESGGVDGAGVYFSLDSGRDGLQGLNAIYYGVKDGKAVKICRQGFGFFTVGNAPSGVI